MPIGESMIRKLIQLPANVSFTIITLGIGAASLSSVAHARLPHPSAEGYLSSKNQNATTATECTESRCYPHATNSPDSTGFTVNSTAAKKLAESVVGGGIKRDGTKSEVAK